MNRTISKTQIGDYATRHKTRIEDDPTTRDSLEARNALFRLMETLINSPDLLNCGLNAPTIVSFKHNGSCWVVEAEAVSQEG